jgi:hypothetical protein
VQLRSLPRQLHVKRPGLGMSCHVPAERTAAHQHLPHCVSVIQIRRCAAAVARCNSRARLQQVAATQRYGLRRLRLSGMCFLDQQPLMWCANLLD